METYHRLSINQKLGMETTLLEGRNHVYKNGRSHRVRKMNPMRKCLKPVIGSWPVQSVHSCRCKLAHSGRAPSLNPTSVCKKVEFPVLIGLLIYFAFFWIHSPC